MVNVLIAFILDAFLLQMRIESHKYDEGENEFKINVQKSMEVILGEKLQPDQEKWIIERLSLKTLFYESLFGDDDLAQRLKSTPIEGNEVIPEFPK